MKRIITFMMALALVLSLGIAAFAAGDGAITVTNATIGVNYKLYKIFDATFVAGGTDANGNHIVDTVAYTLETSSPVYTYMFGTLTPDADGNVSNACFNYNVNTGVITKVDTADKDDITAYLTEMVRTLYAGVETAPADDECFAANQTATSQVVAFTGLDYGYYLIDTATNADADPAKIAVTITTNTPSIEVIEKNQLPGGDFSKDISSDGTNWEPDDENSLSVGDTAYFKLSFTATNYDDDRKVTYYTITDTLNPAGWAEIDPNSIQIKILKGEGEEDIVLSKGTDWVFNAEPSATGFEIKINWVDDDEKFKYNATEVVEVTYNAVVTKEAASNEGAQENKNEAELNWDSNTDKPEEDDTKTYVFNLGFAKVDGKTGIKLAGAEFALTDANGNAVNVTAEVDADGNKTGVYIVDKNATSNIIKTQADGEIIVKGLAAGTYYLEETKAPDGYNKLEGKTQVVVAADKATTYKVSYTANNANTEIQNNSGVELPSTGGKGTMMLITFGSVVAMAFAMLLITQKKMSIYRD